MIKGLPFFILENSALYSLVAKAQVVGAGFIRITCITGTFENFKLKKCLSCSKIRSFIFEFKITFNLRKYWGGRRHWNWYNWHDSGCLIWIFEYKDVMGHAVKSIFAVAEVWINLISILFSGMLYYQRFSLLTFFTQGNGEFGMTKIIWYIMLNK